MVSAAPPFSDQDPTAQPEPQGPTRVSRAALQLHLSRNLRLHWARSAVRVLALVACDLAVYWALRSAIWALRDGAIAGNTIHTLIHELFPIGFLGGWRFAWALVLSLFVVGAYRGGDPRRDPGRMFAGAAVAGLISLYSPAWSTSLWLSAVRFLAVVVAFGVPLVLCRWVLDWFVWRFRPRFSASRTLVIARGEADVADLEDVLGRSRDFAVVRTLRLDDHAGVGQRSFPFDIGAEIDACRAETVLLWGSLKDDQFARAVDVSLASGCRLLAGTRAPTGGVEPRGVFVGGRQLVELTPPTLRTWQVAVKRLVDVVGSVVGLILLAPVFAAVAAAIVRESGRPVFFRQQRIGRGGKPFRILKFRSMVVDAERRVDELRRRSIYGDERLFKVVGDPRVTRLGQFLRRTSLDELPQLINVLKGEMSLVGPRPPIPSEVSSYEEHHFRRFDVKPGITGPWQVGGRNSITDFEEVVLLESLYVRRWSMLEDLRIMLRTIPVVLRGYGAH
jgi:exopolysaccharide biosynthesis polyprenyl glycosylphosphotransferase